MNCSEQSNDMDQNATLRDISGEAVSKIMQEEDVDADLLDILTRHIVVSSPEADAVKQAADDIVQLATERAKS